jgi:hypothetical protein
MRRLLFGALALTGLVAASGLVVLGQAPPSPAQTVDFVRDVKPILEARCYECHGPRKSRGRLRLDFKASAFKGGMTGPAILAGKSADSLMIHRVLGLDDEDRMPLDADPLTDAQIALLKSWIDQGAAWPDDGQPLMTQSSHAEDHWAYRRPRRPAVPTVSRPDWVRTPIDQFVLARLDKEGLQPTPEASREALIRRVSLDLIGLPPTIAEVEAFVADTRPDAYERLVDRLLASPHYGERWARPWLDLARYADSNGYEKDGLRMMWKYRDWAIKALNDDMPFDRFTVEQLAGDMLPDATTDQQIASGFHRNTQLNQEGGIDVEEARWEALLDRVNTTATVWLGSTIQCAQCHNHKYDPFSQRDYYRLLAFFDNVEYTVFGQPGQDHFIQEPTLDLPTPEQSVRKKELTDELTAINAKLTGPDPDIDARQGAWEEAQRTIATGWTSLAPDRTHAEAATLSVDADGSVLAGGRNAGIEKYVIEAPVRSGRLTALRLEALPHPSLPKGGPGRDFYGNFLITGFHVELLSTGGTPTRVAFSDAKSDDAATGDAGELVKPPVRRPSRESQTGWAIDATRDATRLPRQAVFLPEAPLTIVDGTRMRVTLDFNGGNVGQAIGRLRLSVTDADDPTSIVALRAKTRAALPIAVADRTADQQRAIMTEYRQSLTALKPLRDRAAEIEKALKALGIVTALVMKEKPTYERPSTPLRERGAYLTPGERVTAGTPEILPPLPETAMPNRLGLARWLVAPDNPLTARVAVNRAWEQFFGRGLVETSEDFGTQGAAPSHPELLDWLAIEFQRLKWSPKALHRLIVTSAVYRQDAGVTPALVDKDPYNRLLARGPRFRMEAEMVRDVALAASGLLSAKVGGPSVFPTQPAGIWDNPYSDEAWVLSPGEDQYRRGLYTFIRRTSPYPSFMTFDATSREFCTVRRVRTNTPLQALTGLNDEAYFEAARALGHRMLTDVPVPSRGGSRAAARARAVYAVRLLTSRSPTESEIDRIVRSYERQRAHFAARPADAAKVAKATTPSPAVLDEAAWALVANALMNLDETLTK